MDLLAAWSPHFQPDTKSRGRELFSAGKARLTPPGEGEIMRMLVEGRDGRSQVVAFRTEGNAAVLDADTAAFRAGVLDEVCWAALLEAARRARLAAVPAGAEAEPEAGDSSAAAERFLALRPRPPKAKRRVGATLSTATVAAANQPAWAARLEAVKPAPGEDTTEISAIPRRVHYALRARTSARHGQPVVEVRQRTAGAAGWSTPKPLRLAPSVVRDLLEAEDRRLGATLLGCTPLTEDGESNAVAHTAGRGPSAFRLPPGAGRHLLREMIATGRCVLDLENAPEGGRSTQIPLAWDAGHDDSPWTLCLQVTQADGGDADGQAEAGRMVREELGAAAPAVPPVRGPVQARLSLVRGARRLDVSEPELVLGGPDGLVVLTGRAAALDDGEAGRWIAPFREARGESLRVPADEVASFMERLFSLPDVPELDLPEELQKMGDAIEPVPVLELFAPGGAERVAGRGQVAGRLVFDYGGTRVSSAQEGKFVSFSEDGGGPVRLVRRQTARERQAAVDCAGAGLRPGGEDAAEAGDLWLTPAARLPHVVAALIARGFRVLADQKPLRSGGPPALTVSSGTDWFEVRGGSQFHREGGAETIALPRLLAAMKSGTPMVRLDDGSWGLLPVEWLERHGMLAEAFGEDVEGGDAGDEALRFARSQAALLAGLLPEEGVHADADFQSVRRALESFEGLASEEPVGAFQGKLRPYQKEGLGWMSFLRRLRFGGILADDMGLGKTVQVLAMLAARRAENPGRPSLIIAPRSLIFNWVDEAAKFTPHLKVLAYTGNERAQMREDGFQGVDLVVTTYGLARRDAESLARISFDYVVLDEAQAVKNPQSQSAKAVRLLRSDHRLALTGTPVENHLGDLWTIFEFLNPGFLGAGTSFGRLVREVGLSAAPRPRMDGDAAEPEDEVDVVAEAEAAMGAGNLKRLASALRPFILRRTKEQVLTDLPAKTEQILHCEMGPDQRRAYDELRTWYRQHLSERLDADGGASGAISGPGAFMVLEALLRLRQAACHPALINGGDPFAVSAKCEELESRLEEIVAAGSKSLVFSQFTSFLTIIEKRLAAKGIRTCRLDGTTRNRREVVEAFQKDPELPVFLISLKAGGVGLNLTAAEYVFLMDPWWNPAAEAQAVDRTHRIGQQKPVFAYRMVAEGTVERRILDLQAGKRDLAKAIVGEESGAGLIGSLTKDEILSLFRDE